MICICFTQGFGPGPVRMTWKVETSGDGKDGSSVAANLKKTFKGPQKFTIPVTLYSSPGLN